MAGAQQQYRPEQSYQLTDYLAKLPGTTFRKLYQQPSTAFAIFRRLLTPLAKSIVQALLYMPTPLPVSQLDVWVTPDAKKLKTEALVTLKALYIIQYSPGRDRQQDVQLTTNFKNSLQLALEGSGDHNSFGIPSTLPVDPTITIEYLDAYASKKWEDILHYVVNSVSGLNDGYSGGSTAGPKASVKQLLLAGNLVKPRRDTRAGIGITKSGFTFLLQEANAQVWTLLLLWLEAVDASGSSPVDMLSFLFMLASLELGRAYDTHALTEPRRNMLPSLVDFGLIYIPRDTRQYFPTRLATTLTSSASALRSVSSSFAAATANTGTEITALGATPPTADDKSFIILETNYRIYAYTSSPLQIAVLSLFTQLHMRFPGMVTGRLTRDSVRKAIGYGITADQIITYLGSHAHDEMRRRAKAEGKSVLPPTVMDQIRLWQLENERMFTVPGFLFKDFESPEEYLQLVKHAEDCGICVWKDDRRQLFFASKHEPIRDFLKSRKKVES
ncbi:transcription factor Tfb2-domain-containing protein [Apodospora peruviana]|uniref:RNA polymerase II transcription factor B subunit 2 n=1 Tax=Apodospora peruviana TaxID=516989 RepID=A0AAE0M299_9PEZI|nr:transcription factor Tfb2-domain-containing protein [Apodospora peruviana]